MKSLHLSKDAKNPRLFLSAHQNSHQNERRPEPDTDRLQLRLQSTFLDTLGYHYISLRHAPKTPTRNQTRILKDLAHWKVCPMPELSSLWVTKYDSESGIPSPQPTSAHLGQETFATGSNQTLTPSRPTTSIWSTPPPTGFTASSIHRHRNADDSPAKQPGPPSSLVDSDFRTRFAERRRLQLSGVSPLATPSLRQQSSEHIRESRSLSPGRSLTTCTFTGSNEDLIEMCSTPTAQVDDGQDISQQPDSAGSPNFAAPRHRARSQLSLMIQRLRQKEGDNIGDTVEQKNGGDLEAIETLEI